MSDSFNYRTIDISHHTSGSNCWTGSSNNLTTNTHYQSSNTYYKNGDSNDLAGKWGEEGHYVFL